MIYKIEITYDDVNKHMSVAGPLDDKMLCIQMMGDALRVIARAGADKKVILSNGHLPDLRRN